MCGAVVVVIVARVGKGELGQTKPSKREDDDWMNVEIQGKTRSTVHAKGLLGDMSCRLMALWSRTTKNYDVSTRPLILPIACWLTPFNHSLTPKLMGK